MFYKIYFWFYLVFLFLLLSTLGNTASFVLGLSQLILLIALYSNGYKKDFFSANFWKISFVYSVLGGVATILLATISIFHFNSVHSLIINLIISFILITLTIPAYISLYIYVFKKRKVFSKINKPRLWKIYFWFLLIISIGAFIFQGIARNWDIADLLISAIAILGLYAFCWNKKILNQMFWKTFFLANIVWMIALTYIIPPSQQLIEKLPEKEMMVFQQNIFLFSTIGLIISLILLLPLFVALYSYGFKSEGVWKNNSSEKM